MSELHISNLHIFFRYTVTGASITFWLILSLPPSFVREMFLSPNGAIMSTTALLLLVLVIGWASYHAIYPFWRRFLSKLNLYPKSLVRDVLTKHLSESKSRVKAREVWSYYLWNYCSRSIRTRVKRLADYGHSLYIVSFAFIFFPVFYILSKSLTHYETVLDHLLYPVSRMYFHDLSLLIAVEGIMVLVSLIVGTALLKNGKDRIEYAETIQWLILQENKDKVQSVINSLKPQKDPDE